MHGNDDRDPRTSVRSVHSVHCHKASEYVSALTCSVTNGRLINREKEPGRGPGRRRGVTTSDFFGRIKHSESISSTGCCAPRCPHFTAGSQPYQLLSFAQIYPVRVHALCHFIASLTDGLLMLFHPFYHSTPISLRACSVRPMPVSHFLCLSTELGSHCWQSS